jgi:hypothetical protein
MAKATGSGSKKTGERQGPPRVKQDNRGRDNQGKGPLVDNKDASRNSENRRDQEKRGAQAGSDPRDTNRGDRNDQPASSAGRPTYGGG